MRLQLERPLVILDLEATGVNPRYDRIIEIAAIKLCPDGTREQFEHRVNPECPVPQASIKIHGITDLDLERELPFRDLAGKLSGFLRNADLAGFGILQFDLPLLTAEFARVGIAFPEKSTRIIDAKSIFHKREPRTLGAALEFYRGRTHDDAHQAMSDVVATLEVIEGQLERYTDLPDTLDALNEYCNPPNPNALDKEGKLRWEQNDVVIGFGQKNGCSLRQLAKDEPGYLRWILKKDFSDQVKSIVTDALDGRFPRPSDS